MHQNISISNKYAVF